MFRPAGLMDVYKKTLARRMSEASLTLRSAPGADIVPLHRLGFGMSLLLDPKPLTLLEVLGDDPEQRAETIAGFLNRCTDQELEQLQRTFMGAVVRRSA